MTCDSRFSGRGDEGDTRPVLDELEHRLAKGADAGCALLVGAFVKASKELVTDLPVLVRLFEKHARLDLLFACLVAQINHGTRNLAVIGFFLIVGEKSGQMRRALAIVARRSGDGAAPIRFGSQDFLASLSPRDEEGRALLARLKYPGYELASDMDIFAAADRSSQGLDLEEGFFEYLWHRSHLRSSTPVENWRAGVCAGYSLDHLWMDLYFMKLLTGAKRYVDLDAWHGVQDVVRTCRGCLLSTFHGGLFGATLKLFSTSMDGGITLASRFVNRLRGNISVEASGDRGALFAMLRCVQDEQVVLMAPDGPKGSKTLPLNVLGVSKLISEGAAFVAYESGRANAWFTVVRKADRLVPKVVMGPSRLEEERFPAFRMRWAEFYSRQIESVLLGDPKSLALRGMWTQLVADAAMHDQRTKGAGETRPASNLTSTPLTER